MARLPEYRIVAWRIAEEDITEYHILQRTDTGTTLFDTFYRKEQAQYRMLVAMLNDRLYASKDWQNGVMSIYRFERLIHSEFEGEMPYIRPVNDETLTNTIQVSGAHLTYQYYHDRCETAYFS